MNVALADSCAHGNRANQTKILDKLATLIESTDPRRALEYYRQSVEIEKQIFGEQQQRQITALETDRKLSEDHKLHEQHRSLLLQLMPDEVVARILRGENIIADTYEDTSVMFLDIVGFTDLASCVPAQRCF